MERDAVMTGETKMKANTDDARKFIRRVARRLLILKVFAYVFNSIDSAICKLINQEPITITLNIEEEPLLKKVMDLIRLEAA
jgi:hypothetical protein